MKYIVTESQFQNVIDKFKGLFSKSKSLDTKPSQTSEPLHERARNLIMNHFLKPDEIEYFDEGFAFIKNGKVIMYSLKNQIEYRSVWVYINYDIVHSISSLLSLDTSVACKEIENWLKSEYNIDNVSVTTAWQETMPTINGRFLMNKDRIIASKPDPDFVTDENGIPFTGRRPSR